MATRGRKPRKRAKGAGNAVKVRSHSRTPRGTNRGKPPVVVRGYARGKPSGGGGGRSKKRGK